MITLNLDQIYNLEAAVLNAQMLMAEFDAPQKDGSAIRMHVRLSPHLDSFLQDVYNLCLGPMRPDGEIDDTIRLKHENVGKVLSTTIFIAYLFLLDHPACIVGLDGSNDLRANLYHSMFVHNAERMSDLFVCAGVDWYARRMRNGMDFERDEEGNVVFNPSVQPFDYSRGRQKLYSYYMFSLKKIN